MCCRFILRDDRVGSKQDLPTSSRQRKGQRDALVRYWRLWTKSAVTALRLLLSGPRRKTPAAMLRSR